MMPMSQDDSNNSQMALALLFEQKPEILKKPVQAVHMAITGGIQSKTQRLAFNAMLKHALEEHSRNPGEKVDTYSISRVELMRTINYTSPNRKHLKDTLAAMQKLTVQWDYLQRDGDSIWGSCVLLPFVGFDRDRIYYSYSPQIKPMLLEPKIYARLDLRIQRAFRLDASAALYEWVNRFRTNPSRLTNEMRWEEWRWVIYGEVNEKSVLNERSTTCGARPCPWPRCRGRRPSTRASRRSPCQRSSRARRAPPARSRSGYDANVLAETMRGINLPFAQSHRPAFSACYIAATSYRHASAKSQKSHRVSSAGLGSMRPSRIPAIANTVFSRA